MGVPINRSVTDSRAGGIFAEIVVPFPVLRWSDRPGHEATTAIGADVVQHGIDAGGAERAFIGAYARFERIGQQTLVAIFTCWS